MVYIFLILKPFVPLQGYLVTCQANSAIMGRFFCTRQQQLWRGTVNFKKEVLSHFYHYFQAKNVNFKTRDFSPLIKWGLAGVRYEVVKEQLNTISVINIATKLSTFILFWPNRTEIFTTVLLCQICIGIFTLHVWMCIVHIFLPKP